MSMNVRKPESARQVEKRKVEHLKIQLTQDPEYKNKTTLFEDVILLHNALPEIDRSDVDTSTTFLGKKLKAPYMVSAITGGAKQAATINRNNAKACQELGLAMGFGSMKAMIVEPSLTYSYQVRDIAPDILLVGNIGANDLAVFPPKVLKELIKKTGIDFLAVHLNPAQELVQKEGEAKFKGVFELIKRYSEELPIYVKECGQGLSANVAKKLSTTKIHALDVGGAGGTSWIGIEYLRRGQQTGPLWDWGIPTALSVIEARSATKLPIIATGGIRSGEDVVKAIVLGANIGSAALPSLRKGNTSFEASLEHLSSLVKEIGDVMFLVGAQNVADLANVKPRIIGRLKELL
jgi:isopentenyl-diphosphate Delta-isomerase